MPDNHDQRDHRLLAELGQLFEGIDPIPPPVIEAARASLAWRDVDAELAELTDDSALAPAAGIRGSGSPRLMTFDAPSITLLVEVTEHGDHRRLMGQLVRPRPARVEVRHTSGLTATVADERGRFTTESVPAGPVSIACRFEDESGGPVVTSWVSI